MIDGARYGVEVLSESENSLITQLAGLISKLNQLREYDASLKDTLDTLEPAETNCRKRRTAPHHYVQRLDLDPERLNECEQRLSAIHATARKFPVSPEQLPDLLDSANTRLAALIECADPAALAQRARCKSPLRRSGKKTQRRTPPSGQETQPKSQRHRYSSSPWPAAYLKWR